MSFPSNNLCMKPKSLTAVSINCINNFTDNFAILTEIPWRGK